MRRLRNILVAGVMVFSTVFTLQASGAIPAVSGDEPDRGLAGSSWAANAVEQWISDLNQQDIQNVYTPSGSARGSKILRTESPTTL